MENLKALMGEWVGGGSEGAAAAVRELGGNEGARGAEGGRQGSAAGHWVPSALFVYSAPPPRPPRPPRPPGANWIDPPKRERKRVASYAESEFYRISLAKREYGPRASGPKLPRMPALQDFQFFDIPRITQLYEKENAHETHKHVLAQVWGGGGGCGWGRRVGAPGGRMLGAGYPLPAVARVANQTIRPTHSLPPPHPAPPILYRPCRRRRRPCGSRAAATRRLPPRCSPRRTTRSH